MLYLCIIINNVMLQIETNEISEDALQKAPRIIREENELAKAEANKVKAAKRRTLRGKLCTVV